MGPPLRLLRRTSSAPLPTNETKPSEINSIYALSKRDQEQLCLIYGRNYDIPVTALRFFNIYGTRQALSNPYTGVAAIFASRLLNNQSPWSSRTASRCATSSASTTSSAPTSSPWSSPESNDQVINIGCGTPITIRRVAEILAESLGRQHLAPVITNKYRAGDIRHCYADLTKAKTLLGYQPQVTHEAGFTELAAWLARQAA